MPRTRKRIGTNSKCDRRKVRQAQEERRRQRVENDEIKVREAFLENLAAKAEQLEEKQAYLRDQIHQLQTAQEEIHHLQILQRVLMKESGIQLPPELEEFPSTVLAALRGPNHQFEINSRQVVVGRSTDYLQVDIDLSLEGLSRNVSRFQAVINCLSNGQFLIYNCGSRDIWVDDKSVPNGYAAVLKHYSSLVISNVFFLFKINQFSNLS